MIPCYRGRKNSNLTLQKLLNPLPPAAIFVDAFGGSAAVSVGAWKTGKYRSVVYNDLDRSVVDCLIGLRDMPERVKTRLFLTPQSRAYLLEDVQQELKSEDVAVRAAALIYLYAHSNAGLPNTFLRPSLRHARRLRNDQGAWERIVERIDKDAAVLRKITLECWDAKKIINAYSKGGSEYEPESILFFFDPPYGKTQGYAAKFTDYDLLSRTFTGPWKVAICGDEESLSKIDISHVSKRIDLSGGSWAQGSFRQFMFLNLACAETIGTPLFD